MIRQHTIAAGTAQRAHAPASASSQDRQTCAAAALAYAAREAEWNTFAGKYMK